MFKYESICMFIINQIQDEKIWADFDHKNEQKN